MPKQNQDFKDELEVFNSLDKGDKILFNERKTPLTVTEIKEDKTLVDGPKTASYEIYRENEVLLFCTQGNRKYSSYCRDLEKTGQWEKQKENYYEHSKTGETVSISKNSIGRWQIESTVDIDKGKYDLPLYGFNDLEVAEKTLEKIVRDNPRGKNKMLE